MSSQPTSLLDPLRALRLLAAGGISRMSGVPCSSMSGLIAAAQAGAIVPYANAPNEGEALAFAAGVWLGGGHGAVLCQNSGLGNLYNCLTSLCVPYAIPAAILCGWRGVPGIADEPQHALMGQLTPTLFAAAGIAPAILAPGRDPEAALSSLGEAGRACSAMLVCPGVFSAGTAGEIPAGPAGRWPPGEIRREPGPRRMSRADVMALVSALHEGGAGVVVSTGLLSREAVAAADGPHLFGMAGSMGHAAAIALGAHAQSGRAMLVIDGDGSILMRPQALAFVGSARPAAFCHVVVDNGIHESTGGQATLAASSDLPAAAVAFGYRAAFDTAEPATLSRAIALGLAGAGPVFVRLRASPGGTMPPRIGLPLPDMAGRFRAFLTAPVTAARDTP